MTEIALGVRGLGVGAGGAAEGPSLLDNLIAFWPLNESSGDALEEVNSLNLTVNAGADSATGHVYPLARSYIGSQYHSRPGDDALLSMGDVDCTIAAWCYVTDKASPGRVALKYNTATRGYIFGQHQPNDRWLWQVRNIANNDWGTLFAESYGAVQLNTWVLVVVWHDAVNDIMGIQVNNGAVDELTGYSGGIIDSSAPFTVAAEDGPSTFYIGRIGPVMLWKSNPGEGGVLTAEQRTALWNGGAGLQYPGMTAAASSVLAAFLDQHITPTYTFIPQTRAHGYITDPDYFLLWDDPSLGNLNPPDVDPDYTPTQVEYDVLYDWLDDHNMLPAEINAAIGTQVGGRTWRQIAVELFAYLIANPQ